MAIKKRYKGVFPLPDGELKSFKREMLNWASQFGIFLFLDSNDYSMQGGQYECLLGVGASAVFTPDSDDIFGELAKFHEANHDWLFGHLSYDLKNILEPHLSSGHKSKHLFPLVQFVVPKIVIGIKTGSSEVIINSTTFHPSVIFGDIRIPSESSSRLPQISFQQRLAHADYLQKIDALREHIRNGDCYEINFCNEGYAENVTIDPITTFHALNEASPAPFAACYKLGEEYLMCASPERYFRKNGNRIISQPIKGTARRGADPAADSALKEGLLNSEKERAENIMIVDLVRNDLARSCDVGSVTVDELFGIYTFPQVHQMISTVSGTLSADLPFTDAIKNSFPMGSMTGAPKVKVMELIDRYEETQRGLFAGSVGYIDPLGNFDFNVVIRSLFYNQSSKYLSYQTGGAITWDSTPEAEWEEMRLKAAAMERLFQ